ncbi:hypothetical protein HK099_000798 [Clydaea vesicula]|uniref:Large ribosomal subunit protein uL5 C-terminal domain-containing protein n=1 Tax=Clydaea vesicula TaxID=447962 RepID=A0AAD5U8W7_9FUNG|nr:hypothetical protein HK099_000798 [Clydaea vesicula]
MSISSITGKRAEPLFAKKGDSTKKIREGMPMGAKVDLTGKDMYEFLDKLKETVLPRLREWEGVHPSMGRDGSITISLPDHAVGYFPDIEPHFDMYPRLFDTDIKIFSNCANEKDLVLLLSGFGIPFSPKVYVKKTNENGKDPWARYRKKGSSTEVTIKKKK